MFMQHSPHLGDPLPLIVRNAVNGVLSNTALSDQVAKAVVEALEAHEDDLFFRILEKSEDDNRIDIDRIRDFLKP